jgi:hypothetical protein
MTEGMGEADVLFCVCVTSLNSGLLASKACALLLEPHLQSVFHSGDFGDGVLQTICWGWPPAMILQISAS